MEKGVWVCTCQVLLIHWSNQTKDHHIVCYILWVPLRSLLPEIIDFQVSSCDLGWINFDYLHICLSLSMHPHLHCFKPFIFTFKLNLEDVGVLLHGQSNSLDLLFQAFFDVIEFLKNKVIWSWWECKKKVNWIFHKSP
jgi:hypothetical protein